MDSAQQGLLKNIQNHIKVPWKPKKKCNKLGQRQSQTPFSSGFWVQKDFMSKKIVGPNHFWLQKVGLEKILSQKKIWEQAGLR